MRSQLTMAAAGRGANAKAGQHQRMQTNSQNRPPFAVFDFRTPADEPGASCYFTAFETVLQAQTLAEVEPLFAELERARRDGWYAAGFVAYEAAPAFDPALAAHPPAAGLPLAWFGLSRHAGLLSPLAKRRRLPYVALGEPVGKRGYRLEPWQAALSRSEYEVRCERIRAQIRDGNTYQVNFAFPLQSHFQGLVGNLYEDLRAAQEAPFAAWLHTPEWDLVSASPELFFRLEGDQIVTRPMKGTRARGMTAAIDRQISQALRRSPKERAENVMIVDLLRNDLGRIAQTGSVRVSQLFRTERFPTIWQMTSTVEARLRPGLTVFDLFAALFPCGSVTGAPKVRTMSIIAAEEAAPRAVYCGAIGYCAPDGRACFSVPIRTLTLHPDGQAVYPVGSGLLAESSVGAEYAECMLKAQVLRRAAVPPFRLLESIRFEPESGLYLLKRHLDRLHESAEYFGFPCPGAGIWSRLKAESAAWQQPARVRLFLDRAGYFEVQTTPEDFSPPAAPWRVALAKRPVNSRDVFLYHKTTNRGSYDRARADWPGLDDVLLYNERRELTESCRANLAVKLAGQWVTPPIRCGLLGGTMRAELLERGELVERVVTLDDLPQSEGLKLLNSIRGEIPVELVGDGQ